MSTKILNLAWDVDLPLSRKMVLIALADQSNDRGECYPGIASLQRRCSMAERTVYLSIAELEADGYLSREQLPGYQTLYRIHLEKLTQRELLPAAEGCTTRRGRGASGAGVGVQHMQDCTTYRGAGNGKEGGARGAVYKSNQDLKATKKKSAQARAEEFDALPPFERQLLEPYQRYFPTALPLGTVVAFLKHRGAIKRPMSISAAQQLQIRLKEMAADGIDLQKSLELTVEAGLALPVDPRASPNARGSPNKPRPNDDFSQVQYTGTADDDLPAHLRSTADAPD